LVTPQGGTKVSERIMAKDLQPSDWKPFPETTDGAGAIAVLAHSMLGTVTAIRGAIDLAGAEGVTPLVRDSLMLLAVQRLDFLATQLRDLAAGIPGDAATALDPRMGLADGTHVEVYSAFNRAWTPGFEIAGSAPLGYRIRRRSDGSLLPGHTSPYDLRPHEGR
jgi:hypothetical protein